MQFGTERGPSPARSTPIHSRALGKLLRPKHSEALLAGDSPRSGGSCAPLLAAQAFPGCQRDSERRFRAAGTPPSTSGGTPDATLIVSAEKFGITGDK